MTASDIENRRAHRRVELARETEIAHDGGRLHARILNISLGGAGLQMDMRLSDATEITLEIENVGIIPARIVRQMENGVGVKFAFSEEKEQALIQKISGLLAKKRRERFHVVN